MKGTISFRPLAHSDLSLLQSWLSKPHVEMWWREHLDLLGVQTKFSPRINGIDPTHVFLIEYDGKPVGWIQWYRWSDYPDHAVQLGAEWTSAGIDLALGEEEFMGIGLGPKVIRKFLEEFIFVNSSILAVMTDPEIANHSSLRAFEKAGFVVVKKVQLRGEDSERFVVRFERQD